ncbi:MAG TPA: hypothetical protein VFM54_06715 [Micromonosporaceae bacterium]|nr:hypothetical protein [Micromonosporaceae bacterium]
MTRGSVLAAGVLVASVTVAFSAGCGTGQITGTDRQVAAVPGVSTDVEVADGRVSLRNVLLTYPGTEGYPRGGSASVQVAIFNDTEQPLRVRVSSPDAAQVVLSGGARANGTGRPVPPTATGSPTAPGSPTASPPGNGSASPGAGQTSSPTRTATASPTRQPAGSPTASPAGRPNGNGALLEIPPRGYAIFTTGSPRQLRLVGLANPVRPGQTVRLRFEFTGGAAVDVNAGIAPPLVPAPRSPMEFEESHGVGPGHG